VIAGARADPARSNIGTTTVGSTNHLVATLFKALLALDVVIVPTARPVICSPRRSAATSM